MHVKRRKTLAVLGICLLLFFFSGLYLNPSYCATLPDAFVLLSHSAPAAESGVSVQLTTLSTVTNGKFRILLPSVGGAASRDGVADQGGFDFASATVTCPGSFSGYNFSAGIATPNAITIGSQTYHAFTCAYSGSGGSGVKFDGLSREMFQITGIINPAADFGHTVGIADIHQVIVQHLNSGNNVVDQAKTKVGVIEAVSITATVLPQLTFEVLGMPAGVNTICGWNNASLDEITNVSTTASSVPFGKISALSFTRAAQQLLVSTNAVTGYLVTAIANDQLGKNATNCSGDTYGLSNDCIWDANVSGMTEYVAINWTNLDQKGFAYSLHDLNNTTLETFTYDQAGASFYARHFADAESGQIPVLLFEDTSTADLDNLFVCYKISPDANTQPGDYQNVITYTATANF